MMTEKKSKSESFPGIVLGDLKWLIFALAGLLNKYSTSVNNPSKAFLKKICGLRIPLLSNPIIEV